MQKIVKTTASRVDDVQSIAREMISIESANQYTDYNAQRHNQGHIAIIFIHILHKINCVLTLFQISKIFVNNLYSGTFQKVDTIGKAIFLSINNAFNTRLDDELCTFYAW